MTEPDRPDYDIEDDTAPSFDAVLVEEERSGQIMQILSMIAESRGLKKRVDISYISGDPPTFSAQLHFTQEGIRDRNPAKVAKWLFESPDII